MAVVVFTFGALAIHYTIRDIKNPDHIGIPFPTKDPSYYTDLYKEPIPMSKIGKKRPTFKELW